MFRKCCLHTKYAQLAAKEEAETGDRILPPVKMHLPAYAYSSFPAIDQCHRRALVGEALKESFVGK